MGKLDKTVKEYKLYYLYESSIDNINTIRYIGCTVRPLSDRLRQHIYEIKKSPTTYKNRWLTKCIKNNIEINIKLIKIVSSELEMFSEETQLIELYKSNGYKLTNAKISDAYKQGRTKNKLAVSFKNKGNKYYKNKSHSLDTKNKISKKNQNDNNGRAIFTNDVVLEIKKLAALNGYSIKSLVEKYNSNFGTISGIVNIRTYKTIGSEYNTLLLENYKKRKIKLTQTDIIQIRQLILQNKTNKEIATLFNVNSSVISKIRNNQAHKI